MSSIDFSIHCNTCGNDLDSGSCINTTNRGITLEVTLCSKCEEIFSNTIESLQEQIEELKEQIENMEIFK
jgi:hypothetical protein